MNFQRIIKENKINKENSVVYIVFSGESDGTVINKKLSEYPLIKKIDIDQVSITIERENIIAEEAYKKVQSFILGIKLNNVNDYYKSIQGILFNNFFLSMILKEKISIIIKKYQPKLSILIGKKDSIPCSEELFNFPKNLSYHQIFSEEVKEITKECSIPLNIYKSDRLYWKSITKYFKKRIFLIGFIKKKMGYRILIPKEYNVKSTDNKLILLRGLVHVKLASRLLKENKNNVIFLYDSKKISEHQIRKYLSIDKNKYKNELFINKYSMYSFYDLTKIFKSILIINQKIRKSNVDFLDSILISMLISKEIIRLRKYVEKKNTNTFITFEETNLFGAIFSQAIVPQVNNSFCVQHGFTVSFYKTLPLISKRRWVWGPYFKNEYISKGEKSKKIEVKGKELLNIRDYEVLKRNEPINILLAPAYYDSIEKINYWIHSVIKSLDRLNINSVKISIHPNQPQLNQLKNFSQILKSDIEVIRGSGDTDLLDSELIISGNTTVGFEASLLGKNVFLYLLHNDKIIYNYALHPFIEIVNEEQDFLSIFYNIDSRLKRQQHLDFINKYAGLVKDNVI